MPEAGERFEAIEVSGIVGLRGWRRLLGLLRLPLAVLQALRIVRRFRRMWWSVRVVSQADRRSWRRGFADPDGDSEQNAMPGVTNRILGRLVARSSPILNSVRLGSLSVRFAVSVTPCAQRSWRRFRISSPSVRVRPSGSWSWGIARL